ncbi:chromosomal replication initiator protein DnaA [Holospora elegans E1]|uniref:Chromosomal replication initiator protein DnaA n=1 Tax=Holospora elegans E1 TaxID=1427503 RepID=A0A023DYT0_9PROT|nr:chromosomal replication initiator protein DnaA [Holospora elegans]GAJ46664.1 chromosomal replication initiator protein DnaA [Holospora elegans E1]
MNLDSVLFTKEVCPDSSGPEWRSLLSEYFGQSVYRDWFAQLKTKSFRNGILVLCAPSLFVKDWIEKHYLDLILPLLKRKFPQCCQISLIVEETVFDSVEHQEQEESFSSHQEYSQGSSSLRESQGGLQEFSLSGYALDPKLIFDNFIVGKPNEFAHAAARRVAECDEAIYNPLFLYGPVGHGKTHLMHSIAHHILERSQYKKRVLYLSAEKFMYDFVRSLRYKNVMAFKEHFRSVHVLIIDDVQFISGKDSTQEEFFHTFNALVDQKRQIIISADKSPTDLDLKERMKSRLSWGLVADIHPTTYELRLGILQSKAASLGISIDQKILDFLASKISSNVRELEGALLRVSAHGSLVGKTLTLPLIQEILKDVLRPYETELTVEFIQKKVAEFYNLKVSDLNSAKRLRNIVRPRQVAMYLSKQLTTASLPYIGKNFGGRDHTTVIHGISTIENLLQKDKTLQEDVTLLRKALER